MGFSRPVRFDGTAAILVCKGERDLLRVSKLPRRAGERESGSAGVGVSLDTLPRSRSLLQTKMAAVPTKRNPTEKYGDCEQSN